MFYFKVYGQSINKGLFTNMQATDGTQPALGVIGNTARQQQRKVYKKDFQLIGKVDSQTNIFFKI